MKDIVEPQTHIPCPERSSKAVTIHISLSKTPWNVGNGPLEARSPPSKASSSASSFIEIRSFKTLMRSLKKSMLTKWANLEIPESAEGSNGVGVGFLRIRKYKAKSSFKVSVCCILAITSERKDRVNGSNTHDGLSLLFIHLCTRFPEFFVDLLMFLQSFFGLLAKMNWLRFFAFLFLPFICARFICVSVGRANAKFCP